jgi:hypothetical protein
MYEAALFQYPIRCQYCHKEDKILVKKIPQNNSEYFDALFNVFNDSHSTNLQGIVFPCLDVNNNCRIKGAFFIKEGSLGGKFQIFVETDCEQNSG